VASMILGTCHIAESPPPTVAGTPHVTGNVIGTFFLRAIKATHGIQRH
jgi:hypothetical protein